MFVGDPSLTAADFNVVEKLPALTSLTVDALLNASVLARIGFLPLQHLDILELTRSQFDTIFCNFPDPSSSTYHVKPIFNSLTELNAGAVHGAAFDVCRLGMLPNLRHLTIWTAGNIIVDAGHFFPSLTSLNVNQFAQPELV